MGCRGLFSSSVPRHTPFSLIITLNSTYRLLHTGANVTDTAVELKELYVKTGRFSGVSAAYFRNKCGCGKNSAVVCKVS